MATVLFKCDFITINITYSSTFSNMAHRKFEAPRHGSLQFLPKKRCRRIVGKIKSFPRDNVHQDCHLTASLGYKCGMTHVERFVDLPNSKLNKKEVIDAVTILETPPLFIVGFVGYMRTPQGVRSLSTVWINDIDESIKRNYYKNWYKSKKKSFRHYNQISNMEKFKQKYFKYCSHLRCIVSSEIKNIGFRKKKSKMVEIQINGGNIRQKLAYIEAILGKKIPIDQIFSENELVDIIGITKGKGFQGVVSRWGVTKLPRKTHRGARKVACVGSWHPSRVSFTVPRAGQSGYHHRTSINIKIYGIGKNGMLSNIIADNHNCGLSINPMGGFPFYGLVKSDFLIAKGGIIGSKKRTLIIRKSIHKDKNFNENIKITFIDTSSKWGHGKFQNSKEKKNFLKI
mmetsp:Transcript_24250/g.54536  ORF Transcript_24250/g.54536 Transcript_24250/m.54536 type:complete len:399 (-) Transcript_24250:3-1199(-)